MIRSMTGFARRERQGPWGTLTCEIRAVNHRYLELALRMPEDLRSIENDARQLLSSSLRRGKVDAERLEQELVLIAYKMDVQEELDRLGSHIDETLQALDSKEPAGRRLDFLMQELNREANTLSSKSQDADTTRAAVDMKVLIEQMREQVQNVE